MVWYLGRYIALSTLYYYYFQIIEFHSHKRRMQEFLYNVSKIVLSVWQVVVVVVMEEKVANTTTTKTGPASRRKSFNKSLKKFCKPKTTTKIGCLSIFYFTLSAARSFALYVQSQKRFRAIDLSLSRSLS